MHASGLCLSSSETNVPSPGRSFATAEPPVVVGAAGESGTAAVVVAAVLASFSVTQFGPASALSLLTIGPGLPNGPGPDWPPVAPGVDVAVLAVAGMEYAVVGTNPAVAAVEDENGHPT